jgi:hypothetical protein
MPRRVLMLTDDDIARHKLHTETGVRAFMRQRMADHEDWIGSVQTHVGGAKLLVLDHRDPEKPLKELLPYNHGGRPLVHRGGITRASCGEPGCPESAIHGNAHCVAHMKLPHGYGENT